MEQEHVDVVLGGPETVNKWRECHPKDTLDLFKADLRGKEFVGIKFGPVRLEGAELQNAKFHDCTLHDANLRSTKLHDAEFTLVQFDRADLTGAQFIRTKLFRCNFNNIQGEGAVFTDAEFNNHYFASTFLKADFSHAQFTFCTFEGGRFIQCDVKLARIDQSKMSQTRIQELINAHTCAGLEYAKQVLEDRQKEGILSCRVPWHARYLGWETIRKVGNLPLFGISYFAVIAIPVFMYAIARYNGFVDFITSGQHNIVEIQGGNIATHLPSLYHVKTPTQMLYALISAIALATATTLYRFVCPDRIKEFTREGWMNQLDKELIQYLPLSWRHQYIRWTCAFFYFIGFTLGMWVLLWKVGRAAVYVWQHSEFPLSPF